MGWFNSFKKEEDFLPQIPSLQQVNPSVMQQSVVSSINNSPEVMQVSREVGSNGPINKADPFFVRIDKFNEAKKNLVEIEKKMRDMENVLARLGETKQKEDDEIDSWKQDMKEIKAHLEDINDSVFSRL